MHVRLDDTFFKIPSPFAYRGSALPATTTSLFFFMFFFFYSQVFTCVKNVMIELLFLPDVEIQRTSLPIYPLFPDALGEGWRLEC